MSVEFDETQATDARVTRLLNAPGVLVALGLAGQLLALLGFHLLALSPRAVPAIFLLLWTLLCAAFAITIEARFWLATLGCAAGFLIAALRPGLGHFVTSAANFGMLVTVLTAWRKSQLGLRAPAPTSRPDA